MSKTPLPYLLAPGRIGPMALRNRIVVTAMAVCSSEDDGTVSERLLAYHEEQARGGVGLIIMGAAGVAWPVGAVTPRQIAISDDRFIPGLARVAQAVHRHGAKLAVQLHHAGLIAAYAAESGHPIWAASIPEFGPDELSEFFMPEERTIGEGATYTFQVMDKADIATVVRQFAQAAARAKAAGLDGVEIHGAHGYLLASFLSGSTNSRTDDYGGSLENRARLLLEIVAAVRAAVGPDFAVWCKINAYEKAKPGGVTVEEAVQVARMLEAAGVDAITASSYADMSKPKMQTESNVPQVPELNLASAAAIKAAVGVPVIASGRTEPASADAKIGAGQFDFLGMGRKLLADPYLPRKLAEGRADDIRPCIYCYTCVSAVSTRDAVRCAVNPEMGFEYLREAASSKVRLRIVVVGGGPAGMEAARRLDAEGHQVILLERADRLGGTLRFAALGYASNAPLLDWLRDQIGKSRVEVRLNTQATPELVLSLKPDAVLVATGAVRAMPQVPGGDLPHVFSGEDMRQMMLGESSEALKRKTSLATRLATHVGAASGLSANLDFVRKATHQWMPLGERIVIVGGELVGLELAEFLTERGRKVTVLEESARFGRGLSLLRRMRLIPDLRAEGVALHPLVRDIAITPKAVSFVGEDGEARSVMADHVIVAKGARGDTGLADALQAAGLKVHAFGDATGVSYIEGAIRGAAEAVTTALAELSADPQPVA